MFDEFGHLTHLRRAAIGVEQLLDFIEAYLHVFLKSAGNGCGITRIEAVQLLHGVEVVEEVLVTGVGLWLHIDLLAVFGDGVGVGVPVVFGVVDDTFGDALVDDAAHHLIDHTLLGQSLFAFVVVGLQFIAQSPVCD